MNDTLSTALSNIINAEKVGKEYCMVRPSSSTIKRVFELLNQKGYLGTFEEIKDGRGNCIKVNLLGRINNLGCIKPRFSVKSRAFEKFEKRFLPAKDFGFIIVSTTNGIMTHIEAKEKKLGGRLLAFVY